MIRIHAEYKYKFLTLFFLGCDDMPQYELIAICCHSGGLGWDAASALAPMGERAQVADSIEGVIAQVMAKVRPGDHLLCMSNGGFGGIHARLLAALAS